MEKPELNRGEPIESETYLLTSIRQATQMIKLGRVGGAVDLLEVTVHVYTESRAREKQKVEQSKSDSSLNLPGRDIVGNQGPDGVRDPRDQAIVK